MPIRQLPLLAGLALALIASIALARAAPFDQYRLIMWQEHSPAEIAGLRRLGFDGVKLTGGNGQTDSAKLAQARASGLPWYVENMATDFLAPYHRWLPNQSVTALFDAAKARLRVDPTDTGVFIRQPSLSDPAGLNAYQARLEAQVRALSPFHPIFYNLADEAGIGDLAAAWDADIGPASLSAMRDWLRTQYPDLDALNRQWETAFPDWESVTPELTDAAVRRPDQNFSAWADFKAWMDVTFSGAVRAGTDAVHRADGSALAALEGGQIPGWGGYDYGLLAPALDVMEIYDNGNAVDLARAFNPRLIILRTSFGAGPREAHAAWRNLLLGGRGSIVWDEGNTIVRADGTPLPRGRSLSQVVTAIRVVAPVLFASTPSLDPVAVLVSQASFRTRWILDRRAGDTTWWARDAAREYEDNAWTASRRQVLRRLEEIAVQPRLLSSPMLEGGALRRDGIRVLILPHAIALSDREVAEIEAFVQHGGLVLADTEPALFDQHSRRRSHPALAGVARVPEAMLLSGGSDSPDVLAAIAALLHDADAPPRATLLGPDGQPATGISARWLRHGDDSVLALQMIEPWGGPGKIEVRLGAPASVRNLRTTGKSVREQRFSVSLDPVEPSIFSVGGR